MIDLKLKEITEGNTKLLVPDPQVYKEPAHAPVFYNPKMSEDRDISVLVLKNAGTSGKVLDLLAGTGARGIRYANECNLDVTLNDAQPSACELIKRNAELNGLKVRVLNKSAAPLLYKREKYDCIDLDPFGTPAPFMEAAFQSLAPKGLLFVTATDIASLAGVYQKPCYKKYGVASCRTTFERELGIRTLLSYVFRTAMKYEFFPEPLLCYSSMHYARLYLRMKRGSKYVNRGFANLGWVAYEKNENREVFPLYEPLPKKEAKLLGPVWIGSTHDKKFLEKFAHGKKLLQTIYEELDFPLYWDVHRLSSIWKSTTPRMEELFARLGEKGYRASRTHCCGHCVKTNADYEAIKGCF